MGALQNLSCLAAKQLLAGAIKAVGTHTGGIGLDGLAVFLGDRFSDHSLKLPAALTRANERAWLERANFFPQDRSLTPQARGLLPGRPGNYDR